MHRHPADPDDIADPHHVLPGAGDGAGAPVRPPADRSGCGIEPAGPGPLVHQVNLDSLGGDGGVVVGSHPGPQRGEPARLAQRYGQHLGPRLGDGAQLVGPHGFGLGVDGHLGGIDPSGRVPVDRRSPRPVSPAAHEVHGVVQLVVSGAGPEGSVRGVGELQGVGDLVGDCAHRRIGRPGGSSGGAGRDRPATHHRHPIEVAVAPVAGVAPGMGVVDHHQHAVGEGGGVGAIDGPGVGHHRQSPYGAGLLRHRPSPIRGRDRAPGRERDPVSVG